MAKYAYLIGSNGPVGIPRLDFAESDVENIRKVLLSERCGFFVESNLPNDSVHEVHEKLLEIAGRCAAEDTLLIYYAGHGALERGKLYLLWNQTDIDQVPFTSIHAQWLLETMELCPASHKLLILDCCHAGSAKGTRTLERMKVDEIVDARSNQVIFASDRFERAREFEEYHGSFLAHGIGEAVKQLIHTDITASSLTEHLRELAFAHNRLPQPAVPIPFIFGERSGDLVLAPAVQKRSEAASTAGSYSGSTLENERNLEYSIGDGADCDFRSIGQALAGCPPESRLIVRPGIYIEDLSIDTPVEIRALDSKSEVEIKGQVKIHCDSSLLNIKISADGSDAIAVDRGRVTITDCAILASSEFIGIKVMAHANVKIQNSCVQGGKIGLISAFHSNLSVADSEIRDHDVAFLVDRGGEISVVSCEIDKCAEIGIDVRNHSRAAVNKTTVKNCKNIGIEATAESEVNVTRCKIHGNGQGIRFELQSTGEISENEIFDNEMSGLHVTSRASPTTRRNVFRNNMSDGVIVFDDGAGIYENNEVFSNGHHGFDIQGGSNITVRRNKVHSCQMDGLRASERSRVLMEFDDLYLNGKHGLDIQSGSYVDIKDSLIHDNKQCGILGESCEINSSSCSVFGNGLTGIEILKGSLSVKNNKIFDNRTNGVWSKKKANVFVDESDIRNNSYYGVFVQAQCSLKECVITKSGQDGVSFHDEGAGDVRDCRIADNAWGGVSIAEGTNPQLENNLIEDNKKGGVRIEGEGGGRIAGNIIRNNAPGPILVTKPIEDIRTEILETVSDVRAVDWNLVPGSDKD